MTSARARGDAARRREMRGAELARSCGTCAACCVTHRVDAIDKPAGAACRHLRAEDDPGAGRCGIYDERPVDCREWACMWRKGGLEPEERPDRVGVVVDVLSGPPQVLEAAECVAFGFSRPEAMAMIARLRLYGDVEEKPLPADGRKHLPVAP